MTRTIALALASTLALAACAMTQPSPPPPPVSAKAASGADGLLLLSDLMGRERPKENASLPYGPNELQVVDLWLPKGKGPHPTVLMVHGGCWQTEVADRSIMSWISDDLRKRGIAVWNIDYRGVDREGGGYPGTFLDAAAATDSLRQHARRYNLDISRLVAVGHSAGGHLALWLAGRHRLPAGSPLRTANPLPIRHVVSLGGLQDLEQARAQKQGCGFEVIDRLTGGRFSDTSVPRLGPLGISQSLVNADRDRIIPTNFAHDYAAKMKAAGDTVGVAIVPNQGHMELIAPETPAWAAAVSEIQKALRRK